MKKILTLLTLVLFLGVYTSNAQLTGGGTDKSKSAVKKADKGVFSNTFYINFSRSNATGDFGDESLGGLNNGFGLNLGKVYYLNSIDFMDELRIGIDWTILSSTLLLGYGEAEYSFANPIVTMGATEIGPIVSYNPVDKLVVSAKLNFQPTFMTHTSYFSYFDEWGYEEELRTYGFGAGLRTGLGFYASYKPFMLGFEISWGTINLNFEQETFDYDYVDFEAETKTGTFDFVIGFSF